MKHFSCAMEVKDLTDTGSFEGLASVYGNVDLGGDIVLPGAFKEFNRTKDGFIRILDSHNTRAPIGKGQLVDTHVGLAIKGQLLLKVARARDVYELMKENGIDGLSIGYDVLPGGFKVREDGVRELSAIKLWEVSTTAFPMNQDAQVSRVKEIERCTSIRELEELLRDAAGLSRSQAKLHAGEIWKTLTGKRDAGGEVGEEAQQLLQTLNRYKG